MSKIDPDKADGYSSTTSIDVRLTKLRSRISDIGQQIDSQRAKTGAALGGGVFLLLLAVGGFYEAVWGQPAFWSELGITAIQFRWITVALFVVGFGALAVGAARVVRRGRNRYDVELEDLQRELERLTDSRQSGGGSS
ncbi:MAG TPA: hypothetical protein VJH03_18620 [Blastocatellia bacterium]|nr:hypothetical protein [Blastocatellia bacterium]